MVKPLRLALVVLGLALAVYGVASLTGRWLGEPPWWRRDMTDDEVYGKCISPEGSSDSVEEYRNRHHPTKEREGGPVISLGVSVVGLALAAWPRRPKAPPPASCAPEVSAPPSP